MPEFWEAAPLVEAGASPASSDAADWWKKAPVFAPEPPAPPQEIAQAEGQQAIEAKGGTGLDLAITIGKGLDKAKNFINEISPGFLDQVTSPALQGEYQPAAPDDSKLTAIGKGVSNSLTGLIEGLSSPAMVAAAGAGSIIPALAKPVAGAFLADTMRHLPEAYAAVKEAEQTPAGSQARVEAGINMAGLLGITHALASHLTRVPKSNIKGGEQNASTDSSKQSYISKTRIETPTVGEVIEQPSRDAPPGRVSDNQGAAQGEVGAARVLDAASQEVAPAVPADVPAVPIPQTSNIQQPTSNIEPAAAPPPRRLSPRAKQLAQMEAEHRAELIAAANEAQGATGPEILDAIIASGGLPARSSPHYVGELEAVTGLVRNPQRSERLMANKIFRKDAPSLDELATRLRDHGFDVQTGDELLGLVEGRLRAETPLYGMPAREDFASGSVPGYDELYTRKHPGRIPEPDLLAGTTEDLSLVGEKGVDWAARQAETARAAQEKAQADAAMAEAQTELFRPGAQPETLPRQISAATPLPENAGVPLSEADIRVYLSKALDIPVRAGMGVSGQARKALGVFRTKAETIRTKLRNDIPTIAHEVGHYLHHLLLTDPATGKPSNFTGTFDGELMPLGAVTSGKNYTPVQVRLEGVAEFTREWLSDRARAYAAAPNFTTHFEGKLQKDFPQTWTIMENAREQIQRYIAQPGWEKARSRIVFDQRRPRVPLRQWLSDKYTEWFNELAPIDRAVNRLTEFGLDPKVAAEVSARAINYKGGWRGKADFDLEFEQTGLAGQRLGPGLKPILKGLDAKELGDFSTYVALKRAAEKRGQGITTGFEPDLADAAVQKKMSDLAPRYEAKRRQLVQYSENLLGLMHESGFFTGGQMAQMKKLNADYVPFYRIYEGVGGLSGPRGTQSAGGFVNTSAGVFRMRGSDRQLVDPLESIVKNTYMFRDLAERNGLGVDFKNAVQATQGGGRIGESTMTPMKPIKVSAEEVSAKLEALGMDPVDIAALKASGGDLAMTLFRAAEGVKPKDGIFRVWEKGEEKLFQVADKDLLRALTLADSADVKALTSWKRVLQKSTAMLRVGATLTPEFIVRNPFRDQITAGVFSKHGFIPFYDGFRGMLSVLGKDDYYKGWVKSGGRYSGLYDIEGANTAQTLQRVIKDPTTLQQALGLIDPRNVIQNLGRLSSTMEEATRVAEYTRAVKRGADPTTAANAAKDVTLNFSRYGVEGKQLNQFIAFFNAGLQDIDKVIRSHKERPAATATKAFMYITVPSLIAWNLGKDDPKIQNLLEWRKSIFWNFHVGGNVISLPKPFLLGALYGTSVEKALDYAHGKDPNAVRKWFSGLYKSSPLNMTLVGGANAFRPLIENLTNYSFFTGRQLVNESQQKLSPALRFAPGTSETAKWVGEKLGVSPIKIENAIRGYTGGLGMYGIGLTDWFMLKAQGADTPAPPTKTLAERPVFRAFMQSPYQPSEYVQRFYRAMETAETRLNDFRTYGQKLDGPRMRSFFQSNKNELVWYNAGTGGEGTVMTELRKAREELGEINKAMVFVQQSGTLNGDEKAQRLRALGAMRDKLAEGAFKTYLHPTDRRRAF